MTTSTNSLTSSTSTQTQQPPNPTEVIDRIRLRTILSDKDLITKDLQQQPNKSIIIKAIKEKHVSKNSLGIGFVMGNSDYCDIGIHKENYYYEDEKRSYIKCKYTCYSPKKLREFLQ